MLQSYRTAQKIILIFHTDVPKLLGFQERTEPTHGAKVTQQYGSSHFTVGVPVNIWLKRLKILNIKKIFQT
jgi:hypothetical protein